MKSSVRFILLFLMTATTAAPALLAEVFRGDIVQVNRAEGTVTVRYRDQNQNPVDERVFRLPSRRDPQTLQTLESLDVGDEVQLDAQSRNGIWEIQTFITNPMNPGGVVIAQGTSGGFGVSGGTSPALTRNAQPLVATDAQVSGQAPAPSLSGTAAVSGPRNPSVTTVGGFAQPLPGTNDPIPTLSSSNQGARVGSAGTTSASGFNGVSTTANTAGGATGFGGAGGTTSAGAAAGSSAGAGTSAGSGGGAGTGA